MILTNNDNDAKLIFMLILIYSSEIFIYTRQKFKSVTWKFQYFSKTKQYPENASIAEKDTLY